MSTVFEFNGTEYETAGEAITAVEREGSGTVIKFHVSPNLPGRQPARVHRSCALWTYQNRADGVKRWMLHDIWGGTAPPVSEEKPH